MLKQQTYDDALFIFNDNEEQFRAFIALKSSDEPNSAGQLEGLACQAGGGNAKIRPYQCQPGSRVAGIPTGTGGVGYASVDTPKAKESIDLAVANIRELVQTNDLRRVFFTQTPQTHRCSEQASSKLVTT
jgi:hypothetical protein